jgi:signal peptidase II
MLQIIIIVLALLADQLTKFLLVPLFSGQYDSIEVIPGVFNLTYVQNEGASFGIFQGARVFFIIVTIIVLAAATWLMIKYRKKHRKFLKVAIALAYTGALGNLIDRILYGYVRDFFDFRMFDFWKWIFNVADMCLVIGSIMLAIFILFMYKDKARKKDGEPEQAEEKEAEADEAEPSGGGKEPKTEEPADEKKPDDGE